MPAAHLSFISKSATRPPDSSEITLVSCPPMSSTDAASGKSAYAPRPYALISVTTVRAERLARGVAAVAGRHERVVLPARDELGGDGRRVETRVGHRRSATIPSCSHTASTVREPMSSPRTCAAMCYPTISRNASTRVESWPTSSAE